MGAPGAAPEPEAPDPEPRLHLNDPQVDGRSAQIASVDEGVFVPLGVVDGDDLASGPPTDQAGRQPVGFRVELQAHHFGIIRRFDRAGVDVAQQRRRRVVRIEWVALEGKGPGIFGLFGGDRPLGLLERQGQRSDRIGFGLDLPIQLGLAARQGQSFASLVDLREELPLLGLRPLQIAQHLLRIAATGADDVQPNEPGDFLRSGSRGGVRDHGDRVAPDLERAPFTRHVGHFKAAHQTQTVGHHEAPAHREPAIRRFRLVHDGRAGRREGLILAVTARAPPQRWRERRAWPRPSTGPALETLDVLGPLTDGEERVVAVGDGRRDPVAEPAIEDRAARVGMAEHLAVVGVDREVVRRWPSVGAVERGAQPPVAMQTGLAAREREVHGVTNLPGAALAIPEPYLRDLTLEGRRSLLALRDEQARRADRADRPRRRLCLGVDGCGQPLHLRRANAFIDPAEVGVTLPRSQPDSAFGAAQKSVAIRGPEPEISIGPVDVPALDGVNCTWRPHDERVRAIRREHQPGRVSDHEHADGDLLERPRP